MSLNPDLLKKIGVMTIPSQAEAEFNATQQEQRNKKHRKKTHQPQTTS
jgi:hypothetical protein